MAYKPAWGQNVVIVEDNQNTGQIKYRIRCPQCGTVSNNEQYLTMSYNGGKQPYSVRCNKCNANIEAYIQRG